MDEAASEPTVIASDVDPHGPLKAVRNPEGKLEVLHRKGSEDLVVVRDGFGKEFPIPEARRADLAFAGRDRVVAFKDRAGKIFAQVGNNSSSEALVPEDWKTGDPVLVNTVDDGVRFMVHRKLDGTPENEFAGTWYRDLKDGKWTDLKPLGHTEEPITRAAVALELNQPWNKDRLRKMDTEFILNGKTVAKIKDRIPEGRYLFGVNPDLIRTNIVDDTSEKRTNDLKLRVKGVGEGHFMLTSKFSLFTEHSLVQDYLVANTQDEAQSLAGLSTPEVRHRAPDLVLSTGKWQPALDASPGDPLSASVLVSNVGDAIIPPGELIVRSGDRIIGSGTYPEIEPFTQHKAPMIVILPKDWNPDNAFVFVVTADLADDLDPLTNRLTYGIFGNGIPELKGPTSPATVAPGVTSLADAPEVVFNQPFKLSGSRSTWFKVNVPGSGQLDAQIANVDDDLAIVLDLFDQEGRIITSLDGRHLTSGDILYVRIGLRPGDMLGPDAAVTFSWETM